MHGNDLVLHFPLVRHLLILPQPIHPLPPPCYGCSSVVAECRLIAGAMFLVPLELGPFATGLTGACANGAG